MSHPKTVLALLLLLISRQVAIAAEPPERVSKDLLVLYTFERPADGIVRDRSGVGEPLDLRFDRGQPSRGDRLVVTTSVLIASAQPASKVTSAIKQSGELTIEAWVKPADNKQAGPARIVSLSSDPGQRNFTLGQDAGKFDVRLRTSATNTNGIPSIATPDNAVKTELTQVVYTRDKSGSARISVNGKPVTTQQVEGDLSSWSDEFRLILANELTGDRTWKGELHLVGIYSRALSADEVAQNFAAGVSATKDYAALLPPPAKHKVDFVKEVQPIFDSDVSNVTLKETKKGD